MMEKILALVLAMAFGVVLGWRLPPPKYQPMFVYYGDFVHGQEIPLRIELTQRWNSIEIWCTGTRRSWHAIPMAPGYFRCLASEESDTNGLKFDREHPEWLAWQTQR